MADFLANAMFQTHFFMTMNDPIQQFQPQHKFTKSSVHAVEEKELVSFAKAVYLDSYCKLKNPRGSIEVSPTAWVQIALKSISEWKSRSDDQDEVLLIPNGCCSKEDCYINVFYQCVCKHLDSFCCEI